MLLNSMVNHAIPILKCGKIGFFNSADISKRVVSNPIKSLGILFIYLLHVAYGASIRFCIAFGSVLSSK